MAMRVPRKAAQSKGRKRMRVHARPARRRASTRKAARWSRRVTEQSNALDLESGVFTLRSPKEIAASLKRSAMRSRRRKSSPYRSALSMLVFYINRAGRNLPAAQKKILNQAKAELRTQFGRTQL